MLTDAEITAGLDRNGGDTMSENDSNSLAIILNKIFAGLVDKYSYQFETKLEALDDSANEKQLAAKATGCLILLQDLGFDSSILDNKKAGLRDVAQDEILEIVLTMLPILGYNVPSEFSRFNLARGRYANRRKGGSIHSNRIFN